MPMPTPTPDPLDQWLQTDLLQVPDGFSERVMQHIHKLPLPEQRNKPLDWLQWLALLGGALLGLEQLAAFMFGAWVMGAAG